MADDQEQNAQAQDAPEDKLHRPVKVELPDGGSVEVSYTPPAKVEPEQPQAQPESPAEAPEPQDQ